MTNKEFNATGVLALEVDAASAKIRSGPPIDDEADIDLPIWAGILPTPQMIGSPVEDVKCQGMKVPRSLRLASEKFSAASDHAG